MEHLHRRGKGTDVVIGIAEQTATSTVSGAAPFPSVPHGYWAMMETGVPGLASAALMRVVPVR
ncbi:MAG: hypothetical protein ACLUPV_12995 [Bilophila wadsworthia]